MRRERAARAPALALWLVLAGAACRRHAPAPEELSLSFQLTPDPPAVGAARVEVTVADASGRPAVGGTLRLQGNMTHPGMRPTFADCRESSPGRYQGWLPLTMAGDWTIQVEGSFPGGRHASRTWSVPGVRQ